MWNKASSSSLIPTMQNKRSQKLKQKTGKHWQQTKKILKETVETQGETCGNIRGKW